LSFVHGIEFRARLLFGFRASLIRLPAALAWLTLRLVLVLMRRRHYSTPLSSAVADRNKRQNSAMFAMESRFRIVPYMALMW
jgi:hypothetical protein